MEDYDKKIEELEKKIDDLEKRLETNVDIMAEFMIDQAAKFDRHLKRNEPVMFD